jgi:hypothetical protein
MGFSVELAANDHLLAYPHKKILPSSIHFLHLRMQIQCILPPVAISIPAFEENIHYFHVVLQKDVIKSLSFTTF